MKTGTEALILFYVVFWATLLTSVNKFRPFETASIFSNGFSKMNVETLRRCLAGFLMLNLLPVLWFWILYKYLVSPNSGILAIISAACGALSVFAFNRLFHALVASNMMNKYFYTEKQIEIVLQEAPFDDSNEFLNHFLPGVFYLIFFGGFAFIFNYLSVLIND